MAAIVSTLVLAGCTDDVYDPERGIQTVPKENPLGEDFSAPDRLRLVHDQCHKLEC